MISNRGDYIFVKGDDMSRIRYSGSIMPTRSASADFSYPVMGEDVVFLAEAAAERECAPLDRSASNYDKMTFTRKISGSQMGAIANKVEGLFLRRDSWFNDAANFALREALAGQDFDDVYPNCHLSASHSTDASKFYRGASVDRAPVSAMFSDLAKFKRFMSIGECQSWPNSFHITQAHDDPENPPSSGFQHWNPGMGGQYWPDLSGGASTNGLLLSYVMNKQFVESTAYKDVYATGCAKAVRSAGGFTLHNRYAGAVTFMVEMSVYQDRMHQGDFEKRFYVPVTASTTGAGSWACGANDLVSAANRAITAAGISLVPYVNRNPPADFQRVMVTALSEAIAICKLRDRTRW